MYTRSVRATFRSEGKEEKRLILVVNSQDTIEMHFGRVSCTMSREQLRAAIREDNPEEGTDESLHEA